MSEPDKNRKNESIKSMPVFLLQLLSTCCMAAALRYFLMTSKYQTIIANHIEVSTPMNSWKRVLEGLYLLSKDINPYSGDLLHETPFALYFYKNVLYLLKDTYIMFIGFDIATGLLMYAVAKRYMRELKSEQDENIDVYAEHIEEYLLMDKDFVNAPMNVLLGFLFNPFTLFACVGYSTIVIHNFFLALFLCGMVYGNVLISAASLAICSSMSFYPIILIVPLCIYFANVIRSIRKTIATVFIYVLVLVATTMFSSDQGKDFSFIKNVYGCILTVPDLQPNIGLFWYFFTEMFDHFRDLFIWSFQINATILYLIPLSIKFRKQPFLLTVALLFLISIFKSYPSVGDVGFVLSLLPCLLHLFAYCQQGFLVGVIFLITTCLAPILWYLWIYCNSANANFYFGVTLAFAIAQIFLITDLLFAQIKRDFTLFNGKERAINGEEATLSLE